MRYILNEEFKLCGWKNAPFSIMDMKRNKALPLPKRTFELLFKCSGKKDIDLQALSEEDRKIYESLLKDNVIREAGESLIPAGGTFLNVSASGTFLVSWLVECF